MVKIPFLITIDTEGDNLWSRPEVIETKNTYGLYRFQELCNQYGFKPVYLTNYEMAMDDEFVKFGQHYVDARQCEIGMHLHAWNSPPKYNLTDNDMAQQPFLCEYPVESIDCKVKAMTELLRSRFNTPIVSHRAGRWAMSDDYFSILIKYGYLVDCSVTPGVDWSRIKGNVRGSGGTNYYKYPHHEYWTGGAVRKGILEVPMTISGIPRRSIFGGFSGIKYSLPEWIYKLCFRNIWLRPSGSNLDAMKALVDENIHNNCAYLEFMIHSSELSAGLNPNFRTEEAVDKLYKDMNELFKYITQYAHGCTLKEFYDLRVKRTENELEK